MLRVTNQRENDMSVASIIKPFQVRQWVRSYGMYAGVRHARNRGVPFSVTYYSVFGRLPKN